MTRALAIVLLVAGCAGGGKPGPGIDVERAMACMRDLAQAPRLANTLDEARAADKLSTELQRMGVDVERFLVGEVDLPAISVLGTTYRSAKRVRVINSDLLARFGPGGKALLVMAHYDSVDGSPGAVDNAAAACTLVELARSLRERPPAQPVVLAWTADEEGGLAGAEALAERRGGDFTFAIALDLIGGDGDLVVNGASKLVGRAELSWLERAAERAGTRLSAPVTHRVVSRWWPQAERSDHGPFTRRGIPAVHFYNRGQGGDLIDLAYHSPADTPDRVHAESVAGVGRLLRALVDEVVPAPSGDGFWIPETRVVVPRWALVAVELALLAAALALLLARGRGGRDPSRGAGLLAGIGCWLAAACLVVVVEALTSRYVGAWLHAPGRALIAESLVLAGAFGLAASGVARWWTWSGSDRYLALAVSVLLVIGATLLALGAAEVAWVWLIPAALLALAAYLPRLVQLPLVLVAAAPVVLALAPGRLREAAWNGFLPVGLPLAVWVATLGAPLLAALGWWARSRRGGPLGTLVLALGSGLAFAAGVAVAAGTTAPCSHMEFKQLSLRCELR